MFKSNQAPLNYARNRKSGLSVFFRGAPNLAILGGYADDWAVERLESYDPQAFWIIGEDEEQRSLRRLKRFASGADLVAVNELIAIQILRPFTKTEREKISKLAGALL